MIKKFAKKFGGAGFLVAAIMTGNLLNFLFNAILGRSLSLEQFSLLMLVNTLWFVVTILLITITSATNSRTAYLLTKRGRDVADGFRIFITRRSILLGSVLTLIWVSATPFFAHIFHTPNYLVFLVIPPAIWAGIYSATNRGYLQGVLSFASAAVILLTESVSKLMLALTFIYFGFKEYAYLSIPLSVLTSYIVTYFFVIRIKKPLSNVYHYTFPKRLMMATFLIACSSVAFLSIDLLLARHFLSPIDSGAYALLSLVGKIVFFLGSILNFMILTLASRETGLNKNTSKSFYKILTLNLSLLLISYLGLGVFGITLVPILFGSKSEGILSLLSPYTLGIIFFTLSNSFATYHLAKRQYIFAINSIVATVIMGLGILRWHGSIAQLVEVILASSLLYLVMNGLCHLLYRIVLDYKVKRSLVTAETVKKRRKVFTVSICIPAYNEEHNMRTILRQILKQKQVGFQIERIIVASDGSTDNTVKIVKQFADRGVEVIAGRDNLGQTYRQNQLIEATTSDILVLLNADLVLRDDEVILRLINPVIEGADLSAQWAKPVSPQTFIEKVLKAGYVLKNYVYAHHKNGDNIYTCVGHMRALSRRFYSNVTFPTNSAGEDQYLYLACVSGGYKYKYTHSYNAFFKLPDNFNDYKKYAIRIFQTQKKYDKTFSEEVVQPERELPLGLQIRGCIYGLLKYPLYAPLYILMHIVMQQWAIRQPMIRASFETSQSTKKLSESMAT
jgi:glycosyltransferase involved in cell wall biosynthesis/O-antigen/teichoic acid export membrane protein